MKLIAPRTAPDVDDLLAIIEPTMESLGRTLARADDVVTRWRDLPTYPGWDMLALTISWTWHSQTRGPRPVAATIIQAATGGIDQVTAFGAPAIEGVAHAEQFVIEGDATDDQIAAACLLITTDALPRSVAWKEL